MQRFKDFLFNNSAALVVLLAFVAQHLGIGVETREERGEPDAPAALALDSHPSSLVPASLSPQEIAELIRQAIEEAIQERKDKPAPVPVPDPSPTPSPEPTPAPRPVPPEPRPLPVEPMRIVLCDEMGTELSDSEVESGQLFRVSAVGAGDSIGWHPVESGDVRMVASTDGKEYAGYLTAGQWVEFSLTDFASRSQASLRVTCLTAPNPPPVPPGPEPGPGPGPEPGKVTHVRLYVIHNAHRITPDTAIVLNATEVWDGFTAAGSDWKFVEVSSQVPEEKAIIADAGEITLPSLVIYDKTSGRKLAVEPLPKSVIALEALVAKYTEGK